MEQEPKHPLWDILDVDESNVRDIQVALERLHLMGLLEEVVTLIDSLVREITPGSDPSDENRFLRRDADGAERKNWNVFLRMVMLHSARDEYLHALSHVLRGHSHELFGHARAMIENVGVAYLSKSEPELGEVYFGYKKGNYRTRTGSTKILPESDKLTRDLGTAFKLASELTHANFVAAANRFDNDFAAEGDEIKALTSMFFHDVEREEMVPFVRNVGWLLRTAARVLRLFGAAFSLPDCVWYRRLELFERGVGEALSEVRPHVLPESPRPQG